MLFTIAVCLITTGTIVGIFALIISADRSEEWDSEEQGFKLAQLMAEIMKKEENK